MTVRAFVLINCEPRDMDGIRRKLKEMGILQLESSGAYEFVVIVEGNIGAEIRVFVTDKIRKIEGVLYTMTLSITSSWVEERGSGGEETP